MDWGVRYMCPFCDWYFDDHGPSEADKAAPVGRLEGDFAQMWEQYARSVLRCHAARIEAELSLHLRGHVDEMVVTTAPPTP